MTSVETEHKVDRTGWDPGPWDGEPDKLNWTTKAGLPGMIVRNGHGSLCGYVAVAKGHPYYEREYHDGPGGSIEVHGGLTYSAHCAGHVCHVPEPGQPDNVWWLGFDCAHSGDCSPGLIVTRRQWDLSGPSWPEQYRDVNYVRREVEYLARQLAEVQP